MNTSAFEQVAFSTTLTQKSAWQHLEKRHQSIQTQSLISLFEQAPERATQMRLKVGPFYYDYSKTRTDEDIIDGLRALAASSSLTTALKRLASGYHVNATEDRPAWHTKIREALSENADDEVSEAIRRSFNKMAGWVEQLNQGYEIHQGCKIKSIIHIGIGGSDLGPRLLYDVLKPNHQSDIDVHFVSNIDPQEMIEVLEQCDPKTTMVALVSKSFTTQETLENAKLVQRWLAKSMSEEKVLEHFFGISAHPEKVQAFGIPNERCLEFWDWVGGRYSVWSTVSFSVAVKVGMDTFYEFIRGGHTMDEHVLNAPINDNLAVMKALIGIWHSNFEGINNHIILPYDHRLRKLPDYLQQLDMESNGKTVTDTGSPVDYTTGSFVWGQAGTNGQHAFYQLMHQGAHACFSEFLIIKDASHAHPEQHQLLNMHAIAQAAALMQGEKTQHNHEYIPGNKPSVMFALDVLNANTFGQLLSLYEHVIYLQGVIWKINSFDQPGVQLGKRLVAKMQHGDLDSLDGSTQKLLELMS